MSLTQLCRCSHFPAPVALRAPRGPTISSWVSPGFHHLSNTEVSTSHGFFFNGDFFLPPRSSSHFSAQAHWPDRKSSAQLQHNAEGVVISRCPGTRSAPFRRSQDLLAGQRTALRRRQGQGPAPTEGKWGAWPLKSGRDIIFLINKGDMMGM